MGLDDFDPTEDERNEAPPADDANASINLDEDLFNFPVPEGERLSAEDELADAIEAVEEIAASMLPELGETEVDAKSATSEAADEPQLVVPEEVVPAAIEAEPVTASSTYDEELDEDLFGFESIDSTPPARTPDLEENLDEVFGIDTEEPLGVDDAIGELLDAEDDLAREEATRQKNELGAPAPEPPVEPKAPTPEPAAVQAPAAKPAVAAKTIDPTPAPIASASPGAPAGTGDTPELFESDATGAARATARVKTAFSGLQTRVSSAPVLWLIGLMVSTNLLMLVVFWSSLGDVRDLVVETVHKVASTPAPVAFQRAPLRERLERSTPTVQAAGPNEETLTAQETLATSQELITAGEYSRARTGLFRLLARIDAIGVDHRRSIEAEANHLIGETYRGQADAQAARIESLGVRR